MRRVKTQLYLCKAGCRIGEPGRHLIVYERMAGTLGKVHRPTEEDTKERCSLEGFVREALQYTWGMEDVLVLNEMGKPFLMPERRMLLSSNQCLVRPCSASGCAVIGMKNTHCITRYRGPCIWSVNWQTQLTAVGSSHSRGRYTICFIRNYFRDFGQILLNFYFFLIQV